MLIIKGELHPFHIGSPWVKSNKSEFEFRFQNQLHGIVEQHSIGEINAGIPADDVISS